MAGTYTVTAINKYIRNMFQQDFVLNRIAVRGEISNCKYHSSGHIYFTLKDAGGTLSAVMFAGKAAQLRFHLENGMQVLVTGHIDVYERDGKYQLYAEQIRQDGIGDLYLQFEKLKKAYEEMGYFSQNYKRPIPPYADRIGIVTAKTGAAVQDIIHIAKRRNPYISLYLYPALVQGEGAKKSIVSGIRCLDQLNLDCIIVGRGGGSIEDLWAFNEPEVIEAVFAAQTLIISAVGHETDFTITDFVADLRAPTPSAAAELAVTEFSRTISQLESYQAALSQAMQQRLVLLDSRLKQGSTRLQLYNPQRMVDQQRQRLSSTEDLLHLHFRQLLQNRHSQLAVRSTKLEALSPLAKLSGGYSYLENEQKQPVQTISQLHTGDAVTLYLQDGSAQAEIKEIFHGKTGKD